MFTLQKILCQSLVICVRKIHLLVIMSLIFTTIPIVAFGAETKELIIATAPNALPSGTKGKPYYFKLVVLDDIPPTRWKKDGNEPAWLSVDEKTGELSGTPETEGTVKVKITATDSRGSNLGTHSRQYTLTIYATEEERQQALNANCFMEENEKYAIGDLASWLSLGPTVTTQLFRYNFATEKASFNSPGLGVGAAFRIYLKNDMQPHPETGKRSIRNIRPSCRATTLDTFLDDTGKYKASSFMSISPVFFASMAEEEKGDDQDFNLQPAIVAGFFRDLINIGVGFNLAGKNQGQVFLLMGLGVGFKF